MNIMHYTEIPGSVHLTTQKCMVVCAALCGMSGCVLHYVECPAVCCTTRKCSAVCVSLLLLCGMNVMSYVTCPAHYIMCDVRLTTVAMWDERDVICHMSCPLHHVRCASHYCCYVG